MADAAIHGQEHHDDRGFFTRWFMSTNHKDIGILYLFTSGFVGLISVAFTVFMRHRADTRVRALLRWGPRSPGRGGCPW